MDLFVRFTVITTAFIIFVIILSIVFSDPPAQCMYDDCPPRRCSFDVDCGIGCWCYKGKWDIEGTCVSE